jgi:hypothetical protein
MVEDLDLYRPVRAAAFERTDEQAAEPLPAAKIVPTCPHCDGRWFRTHSVTGGSQIFVKDRGWCP